MTLKQIIAAATEKAIRDALARHAGCRRAAADDLAISRSQLHRYLNEFGVTGADEPGRHANGRFSPS